MRNRTPLLLLATALALLPACSTRQMLDIAMAKDPEQALRHLASNRVETWERNPAVLVEDMKTARRNFDKLLALFKGEVGKRWGQDEVVVPTREEYVKYTQNYQSRAMVHFDTGEIVVETLDQKAPEQSLRSAIVTTLLTPDDPRAVDLYSSETVKLSGKPYLDGLVEDHRKRNIDGPARAEEYAQWLIKEKRETRSIRTEGGDRQVQAVRFRMVNDYSNRQAKRYAASVDRNAKRFGISHSLVYAVIKTESAFNPFAVSSAPAYGLMQLVPSTGGRDAYRAVKGRDEAPSKDYLFDPDNNIELGTAYLGILDRNYLSEIKDPVAREYCTIAAYNGGAGNVFKLFSKDRTKAVAAINKLPAASVYRKLRDEHPAQETRHYLVKVLNARKQFAGLAFAGG